MLKCRRFAAIFGLVWFRSSSYWRAGPFTPAPHDVTSSMANKLSHRLTGTPDNLEHIYFLCYFLLVIVFILFSITVYITHFCDTVQCTSLWGVRFLYFKVTGGRILGRNPDKIRKSFTPCYSQSALLCFRFLFVQTLATSYSFCKGERRIPDRKPYPFPYGLRNPHRNLKSENS
jgi:hypothetical protein